MRASKLLWWRNEVVQPNIAASTATGSLGRTRLMTGCAKLSFLDGGMTAVNFSRAQWHYNFFHFTSTYVCVERVLMVHLFAPTQGAPKERLCPRFMFRRIRIKWNRPYRCGSMLNWKVLMHWFRICKAVWCALKTNFFNG